MHNDISLDNIIEILLRLPVKSLSRFKCVCKQWCSLISDPTFARMHVNLVTNDKDVEQERRKLVLVARDKGELEFEGFALFLTSLSYLYQVQCEAMASSNDIMAVKIDLPNRSWLDKVEFIGSFDGLLCLSLDLGRIFLFNPATKELKEIPELSNYMDQTDIYGPTIYGFSYDHINDDYKVVKTMYDNIVYVYSLKTDTWRRSAQRFSYIKCNGYQGVALNGVVHWVFARVEDPKLQLIVAFDFAKGEFVELPRPRPSNATTTTNNVITAVGVLQERLCCLTTHKTSVVAMTEQEQDLWVMKEYGVKESWTKTAIVGIPFKDVRPLSYLKNDEALLLDIDGSLVVYNTREHTHKQVLIKGIQGGIKLERETYVESLISPNQCRRE